MGYVENAITILKKTVAKQNVDMIKLRKEIQKPKEMIETESTVAYKSLLTSQTTKGSTG